MKNIEYDYRYYNVGQGLFHSGIVGDFSFIYDCGSFNEMALENCIRDYIHTNYNVYKGLDLLVLSHFDADHINGLDKLLSQVNVDTVVIPYISLIDRIIIASRNKNEDDWYYAFMHNNVKYLKDKGVKKVIIIKHDQDSPLYLDNNIDLDNNSELQLNWDKMIESTIPNNTIIDDNLGDTNFKVFNDSGHVMLNNIWIFKFYAQEISEKIKVNSKGKKHKGSKPTKERFLQILRDKKIINKSKPINDQIREAIMNPTLRKKIADAYGMISEDLNYTSLMMYNGPLGNFKNHPKYYGYKFEPGIIGEAYLRKKITLSAYKKNVFGQLMTGDAFINTKKQYQEFERHFDWLLEKVIIILVPHHGSNRNWNKSILIDCKNAWLWIASVGFSNKYSHPSYNIVTDIISNGRIFAKCDEFIKISLLGEIEWV